MKETSRAGADAPGFWERLVLELRTGRRLGRVIAVAAPKGGVGKTFIAVNAAWHLAEDAGKSVGLISVAYGGREAPRREATVAEPIARGTVRSINNVAEADLDDVVRRTAEFADFVIVDTPNSLSDIVAGAVAQADDVLVVSNHERTGAKGATSLLAMLQESGFDMKRAHLVVGETTRDLSLGIEDVLLLTGVPTAWLVPFEPSASKFGPAAPVAIRAPQSPAARALRAMANGILAQQQPGPRNLPIALPVADFHRQGVAARR